jgi:fatty acid desaturase
MLETKQSKERIDWRGFKRLLKLMIILLIIISIIFLQKKINILHWQLFLATVMGLIMSGMINLAHECLHQKFTSFRFLNRWIGQISTMLLLVNFSLFKWHHLSHHQYVGTNKDTENNADFNSLKQYLFTLTGLKLAKKKISSSFLVLLRRYPSYINSDKRKAEAYADGVWLVLFLILIIMLTCIQPRLLLFSYWIPLLISYSGIMFFAIPEHTGCKPVEGYYALARSITTNALIRFIMWHGNYHAEHHIFPAVCADALGKISSQECKIYYREKSYLKWHFSLFYNLLFKKSVMEKKTCQK